MGLFSVNIFNRKKLMVDNSAEYIAKCADKLRMLEIPYELHTKRLRSTLGMRIDVSSYMSLNQAYVGNPQQYFYTYTLWVARKNLDRAKRVLGI